MRIAAGEVMRSIDGAVDGIVRTAPAKIEAAAPSTALRAVPLPRFAGEDSDDYRRLRSRQPARARMIRPQKGCHLAFQDRQSLFIGHTGLASATTLLRNVADKSSGVFTSTLVAA